VRISIGLEHNEENLPLLRFDIEDSGIGISDEQMQNLFGAFSQADTSMTRRFGGTGLGLAISQRLARILGGKITAKSTLGEGSVFSLIVATGSLDHVRLIDAQETATRDAVGATDEAPVDATLQGPDALKGIRILLVEDGPDNQRLISLLLRKAGAEVDILDNGRRAVEAFTTDGSLESPLAETPPYDIVLMDMQMPEMDGYTAAGILRALGNHVPIVALTAHALRSEREKCLASGCDDYMTKPVNRPALVRCVRRWVEARRGALTPTPHYIE
jgi:CheY-like chemotaxis protein